MHSRLLRHFLGVVERRSITAAAEALHISQPALTKSIQQLEEIIGVPLFDRLPTGVALTRAGEILARRARLMDIEYQHALAEISAIEQGLAGTLRIGAGPVWLMTILPPVVAGFQAQFPKVKIRLVSGVIDTLVPALLAGEIDLITSTLAFPAHPELVKEPLLGIRHTVVARRSHPLAGRGAVTAEDLSHYPWIALADDQIGTSRIGSFFVANGLDPPTIAVETIPIAMIKILREGDFLAHLPERMLDDAARYDLVRIAHEGTFWEGEAGLAYRRSNQPLRAVESFSAMLRAALSQEETRRRTGSGKAL